MKKINLHTPDKTQDYFMKKILSGKVLIAMMVIAAALLCGSLAYILLLRPAAVSSPNLAAATSALTIIPAPSSTPRPLPPTLTPCGKSDQSVKNLERAIQVNPKNEGAKQYLETLKKGA